MDIQEETGKAKWLLIVVIAFIMSLWVTITELRYGLFGTTVDATITSVEDRIVCGRRGRETPKLQVRYRFTDSANNSREGVQSVDTDWGRPRTGTVPVRYLSGADGASRLADQVNWFGLTISGILFAIVVGWGIKMWLHVRDATRPPPGRR